MTTISRFPTSAYSQFQTAGVQRQSATITASTSPSVADGSTTSSVTKPFSEVVTDARAALDKMFAKFGKVPDIFTTGKEWDSIGVADLDRRTLYAIASNQGGLFSQVEISHTGSNRNDEAGVRGHGSGRTLFGSKP